MSTIVDTTTIEDLDLDFPTPCGHQWHQPFHVVDEAASYLINFSCIKCERSVEYPICQSGWSQFLHYDRTMCLGCGNVVHGLSNTVRIIRTLP